MSEEFLEKMQVSTATYVWYMRSRSKFWWQNEHSECQL